MIRYGIDEMMEVYEELTLERLSLTKQLRIAKAKGRRVGRLLKNHNDAKQLVSTAIELVHTEFKTEIENTVTEAIRAIFQRDIELRLVYEKKARGVDTRIVILENGEDLDPKDDLGGSIIDIISFTFRIILWNMSSPRSRNVFILDEPFRWTGKLVQVTGMIMKELSEKLDFQVIMATHDDELINIADKVFHIEHNGTESRVSTIRKESHGKEES
jgi:DNA repair exonuclease SbcCD ATPase subunit